MGEGVNLKLLVYYINKYTDCEGRIQLLRLPSVIHFLLQFSPFRLIKVSKFCYSHSLESACLPRVSETGTVLVLWRTRFWTSSTRKPRIWTRITLPHPLPTRILDSPSTIVTSPTASFGSRSLPTPPILIGLAIASNAELTLSKMVCLSLLLSVCALHFFVASLTLWVNKLLIELLRIPNYLFPAFISVHPLWATSLPIMPSHPIPSCLPVKHYLLNPFSMLYTFLAPENTTPLTYFFCSFLLYILHSSSRIKANYSLQATHS